MPYDVNTTNIENNICLLFSFSFYKLKTKTKIILKVYNRRTEKKIKNYNNKILNQKLRLTKVKKSCFFFFLPSSFIYLLIFKLSTHNTRITAKVIIIIIIIKQNKIK